MKLNLNISLRGWLLVLALISGQWLLAQRTITGTVTDSQTGEGLIGANILVVGTSTGTVTDFDGSYTLEVPEGGTELEFSYTGYASERVAIGDQTVVDVQLTPGELLEEVVVIGYGSVRKEDLTGAVNTISTDVFNRGAIVNPTNLISGKVAGVQVINNSGEPGGGTSIRVRGGTSINASNEPLYVIDGVPLEGGTSLGGRNTLNFINPSDIETFTVLKDASAAAIYGSRGANGVIIITTKKGAKGAAPRLTYDGNVAASTISGDLGMLDAETFRNLIAFAAPRAVDALGTENTDWFDEITQTGIGQNHNLSLAGGGENSNYRIAAGYQQLEGVIRSSETERVNYALNYGNTLLNGNLQLNTSLKGAYTEDVYNDGGVIGSAREFDPTQPVLDPANLAYGGYFEFGNNLAPRNPVSNIEQTERLGKNFRNIGNLEGEYSFNSLLPGLSFKTNLAFDIVNGQYTGFLPNTYARPPLSAFQGEVQLQRSTNTMTLLESYLNYNTEFGNSRLNFTGGYSWQSFGFERRDFRAYDLSTDVFGPDNIGPANRLDNVRNEVRNNRLISFYGRLNFNVDERYLLTLTVRRDGSTRFGETNRWGTFPSAAFAWRILQEDFAEGLGNLFSDLKLRIGYGITGNQDIGDFRYLPTYTAGDPRARYQFGDQFVSTFRPNGYDANLKWEETSSLNAGLDFGFGQGRINGTLDYYYKRTNDLLFTVNVPAGTNLTDRVLTNIGEVENQGVELTLNAFVIDNPKLQWELSGNAAYNRNQILSIDRIAGQGILTGRIAGGVGNDVQILQVGQPANAFFLYEQLYASDGTPVTDTDENPMYVDRNGDGMINDLDKRPTQQQAPDLILGLTSLFNYGNIDFNFTLRGSTGNYVYNNAASAYGFLGQPTVSGTSFLRNVHESVLVTRFQEQQFFSDYYLEDASFLRLDNVTLGYRFPRFGNSGSLRIYATAQNVFTLTEYTGFDPEITGIDNNPYPRPRTFLFGLTLGL